ncbi:putative quinol monooxygenase [Acetobacter papayae]|uniref:putative quinol monooxygenase n=1 Tax=Acetobacter papayae TaxID=1076592 RepID=UPI00046EBE6D|nr:antibiotic biosynthesis monooxygenase family protein [Acetobacter papayae]
MAACAAIPAIGHAAARETPVRIVTVLPVKPPELTEFLPVMKENARVARAHPGNQAFSVFMDTESPATLYLFESWDSLPDLADFMKTDTQQALATLEQSTLSGEALSLHLSDVPDTPAYNGSPLETTEDAQTLVVRFQVRPQERAAFIAAFHDVIPIVRLIGTPKRTTFSMLVVDRIISFFWGAGMMQLLMKNTSASPVSENCVRSCQPCSNAPPNAMNCTMSRFS